ncbi:MAG: hypothetical protein QOJ35_2975 [Solirubrobacteraceae bacterium]|jgi:hypothetical protein|nr:hypothetical protein [Solirubrobacteraceae bacterium]
MVTLPKIPFPSAPSRTRGTSAASHARAPATRRESIAAPLTLAAVVVLALLLAVAMALVAALGA